MRKENKIKKPVLPLQSVPSPKWEKELILARLSGELEGLVHDKALIMKSRFILLLTIAALVLSGCVSLAEDLTPPPNSSVAAAATVAPAFPAAAPSAANAAAIYTEKCAPCHGVTGMGDGSQSDQLPNPATALGDRNIALQAIPAAWYTAVTKGNLESFMPPFNSLTDQERWDVVAYAYSLSIKEESIALGAELYAENCTLCHGKDGTGVTAPVDFTDQSFMASRSAVDLALTIVNGSENGMTAFGDDFDDNQIAALTDYLRSLTMDFNGVQAVVVDAAPTEAPTEAPMEEGAATAAPVDGVTETPDPESTAGEQEQAQTESELGLGTVTGIVQNGSGEETLPEGLLVQLIGYDHDSMTGNFNEASFAETTINADGSYLFEDVEMPASRAFVAVIESDLLSFSSEPGFVTEGIANIDLPITYYETSTDTSKLSVDRLHIFFEFPDATYETVQVVEVFVVTNPSVYAVMAENEGEATIEFDLPEGAENISFDDSSFGERYTKTENGFGDTSAIAPGMGQHQVIVFFTLPYNKKTDFAQSINQPINSAIVMVPQGIKIKSDLLTDSGEREAQGLTYNVYASQPLPVGATLEMNVSGKLSATASGSEEDTRKNLIFGAIAFGLVLIGAGAWMYLRKRDEDDEEDDDDDYDDDDDEDDDQVEYDDAEKIMDAIIALDDAYRDGSLNEEAYKKRRAELKAQLKDLVD